MQKLEDLLNDYEEKVLDLAQARVRDAAGRWDLDQVSNARYAIIGHVESMMDEAKDEALAEAASEGR